MYLKTSEYYDLETQMRSYSIAITQIAWTRLSSSEDWDEQKMAVTDASRDLVHRAS